MIDATDTLAARYVAATVKVILDDLYAADRGLHAFEAGSIDVADGPENNGAAERRHTALHILFYRHARTQHDVPAILAEIEAMRSLGRTERWQTALDTFAEMIRTDPYNDLDWVLAQYTTFTGHAAR